MANIRPEPRDIRPRRSRGLISRGEGLIRHIHQEDMVHIIYSVTYRNVKHAKYTIVAMSLKAFNAHCVHLSVFLGITLRFISSTLGDVVNVNREADMVSTFFFLDNESLFLFGVGSIFQL